jgi:hypothetical protein
MTLRRRARPGRNARITREGAFKRLYRARACPSNVETCCKGHKLLLGKGRVYKVEISSILRINKVSWRLPRIDSRGMKHGELYPIKVHQENDSSVQDASSLYPIKVHQENDSSVQDASSRLIPGRFFPSCLNPLKIRSQHWAQGQRRILSAVSPRVNNTELVARRLFPPNVELHQQFDWGCGRTATSQIGLFPRNRWHLTRPPRTVYLVARRIQTKSVDQNVLRNEQPAALPFDASVESSLVGTARHF